MEIVKTDILVIGGGGAGMQAALAAREEGAEVLLVSKTPIGKSTCTYLSGGAFSLAVEGASREDQVKRTLHVGKGINERKLVEALVEDAPERVRNLERLGLVGEYQKGRFNCLGKPPSWGAPLTDVLAKAVVQQGISVHPWVVIFEILKEKDRVAGAFGFDFHKGKPVAFLSKGAILANGGGAALYCRHDNPVRITGDGYALALHAGCRLRDMEFVQFIPVGLAEPGKPTQLIAPLLADFAKIINSKGEDVLAKYQITDRPAATQSRDLFSLAMILEEKAGREVFIDVRSLSEDDWPKDNMSRSQRSLILQSFGGSRKPLRISPMCHFFMGGVAAGENGGTEVPGLFAAGEVMGGLHGANRMGGNALAEILVFGYRAGRAAAEWAKGQSLRKVADSSLERSWASKTGSAIGDTPKLLRKRIGEVLWNEGGILRDGPGLAGALNALQKLSKEDLPRLKAANPKEMMERLEVQNALLVGEMIVRSALMREESRGAHFRRDFPQTDDRNWKGNIFLKKAGEEMDLELRPLA